MLDVPAEHDLCGRFAVVRRELDDRRVTPPSGDQTWVAMPFATWKSRRACWVKNGCSSTWLTAGTYGDLKKRSSKRDAERQCDERALSQEPFDIVAHRCLSLGPRRSAFATLAQSTVLVSDPR